MDHLILKMLGQSDIKNLAVHNWAKPFQFGLDKAVPICFINKFASLWLSSPSGISFVVGIKFSTDSEFFIFTALVDSNFNRVDALTVTHREGDQGSPNLSNSFLSSELRPGVSQTITSRKGYHIWIINLTNIAQFERYIPILYFRMEFFCKLQNYISWIFKASKSP